MEEKFECETSKIQSILYVSNNCVSNENQLFVTFLLTGKLYLLLSRESLLNCVNLHKAKAVILVILIYSDYNYCDSF